MNNQLHIDPFAFEMKEKDTLMQCLYLYQEYVYALFILRVHTNFLHKGYC